MNRLLIHGEHAVEQLSSCRVNLLPDAITVSPVSEADFVDGLNAYYFKRDSYTHEYPNIAERVKRLSGKTALTAVERHELAALRTQDATLAIDTLFNGGKPCRLVSTTAVTLREDELSLSTFYNHARELTTAKAATGLTRLNAEFNPSVGAWLGVEVSALDTMIELYKTNNEALRAIDSERTLSKFFRGLPLAAKFLFGRE